MSQVVVLLLVLVVMGVVCAGSLWLIGRAGRPAGHGDRAPATDPARGLAAGMSAREVRRRLGAPTAVTTGRDMFGDASLVVGAGDVSELLAREFRLFGNTPPGHDTLVVLSRGRVVGVEIRESSTGVGPAAAPPGDAPHGGGRRR